MNEGTTRALRIQGDLATSTAMSALLKTHQTLLEKYRRSMNLVGPGPISFHYEDATLALAPVQAHGHWADMGTGAGFPGIVFGHLFPDVSLDLVDSRQKRCWFLNQVLLNCSTPQKNMHPFKSSVPVSKRYNAVHMTGLLRGRWPNQKR